MKNITEILKDFGLEVPTEKLADFNKAVSENYKTVAEHDKKVSKLEAERDTEKERADGAEATLKKFDGIDPAQIQQELETYKQAAETAKQEAAAQLEKRDFNDALKTELEAYSFSSEYARQGIIAQIESAGLKLSDGKILGLKDLMEQIRAKDGNAFADAEAEKNRARFTTGNVTVPPAGTKLAGTELMKLKNAYPELDIRQYI